MSIEEKVQTMEMIWDDLSSKASGMKSPSWHKNILDEREKLVQEGKAQFVDWDIAKKSMRKIIS